MLLTMIRVYIIKKLMSVARKLSERRLCGVGCHNNGGDGTTKTVSGIFQVNVLLKLSRFC